MLKKLNLPSYDLQIKPVDDKFMIFDVLRKKYITLTEEEWVRQNLIHFLMNEKGISRALIKVESGTHYNRRIKRTDILVFSNKGKPELVLECKAPHIKINEDVLFQASVYAKSLKAKFIGVSNGMNHYFWQIDREKGEIRQLHDFPEI